MLIDFFEEEQTLKANELQVRDLCRVYLAALKAKAAYWKQRSKHKAVREEDANTAFHHAQVSASMKRNCIKHV